MSASPRLFLTNTLKFRPPYLELLPFDNVLIAYNEVDRLVILKTFTEPPQSMGLEHHPKV